MNSILKSQLLFSSLPVAVAGKYGSAAPKRLALLALLAAICGTTGAAPTKDDSSIAYRDSYVWYLANHMASSFLKPNLPEDRAQFESEISLLYHHALIDCAGPLDEIASALKYSSLSDMKDAQTIGVDYILLTLGDTAHEIEPILSKWNRGVFLDILEKFRTGKATMKFPACMNPRYIVPPLTKPTDGG